MNSLRPILDASLAELERRRQDVPLAELIAAGERRRADEGVRPFAESLHGPGVAVIAEHKRRSPSAGVIREDLALEDVVSAYESGGAAALSVLTDGPSFGGSLADLDAARRASSLPLLRKDFVVDPYQVHESLAAGADAILLIVSALPARKLVALHGLARELGLDALIEVHDGYEAALAVGIGAELIGVNNRDLTTLEVDTSRVLELAPLLPDGVTIVAESGFSTPAQLRELAAAGVDAVLIGEALMRAHDVEAACRELARFSSD